MERQCYYIAYNTIIALNDVIQCDWLENYLIVFLLNKSDRRLKYHQFDCVCVCDASASIAYYTAITSVQALQLYLNVNRYYTCIYF